MPALAALPDIALAAAGLVLVILAWSIYALRDFLVSGFSHLPGVGGWIGSHLGGWLTAAGNAVTHASASAFGGAEGIFRTVESWSVWVWHVMRGIANDVGDTLWHIATVQVPRVYHLAREYAKHEVQAVYSHVMSVYHTVEHDIARAEDVARHDTAAAFDTARHDLAHAADVARSFTLSQAGMLEHDLAHAFDVARHDTAAAYDNAVAHADTATAAVRKQALQWFTKAELDALREVSAARVAATSAIAATAKGIYTDLDTWGNEAVSVAWPDAEQGIGALRQALGDKFPEILKLLPALGGLGAAGLVGALIRSIAGVNVMSRTMTDCVLPNCDNLGQLGKELNQLSSLGAAAAVLAWLTYIAADPVAAADETVTAATPLVDAVFGPLADLISAGTEHL